MRVVLWSRLATPALAMMFCISGVAVPTASSPRLSDGAVRKVVDATIPTLMRKNGIPGMAVGVTVAGRSYVFNYGVATRDPQTPVTNDTLFELGSLSKTFTATAASWAAVQGYLSLTDSAAKYLPDLQGRPFGNVTLVSLGTHTPGGLPLQVPDNVSSDAQLIDYLKHWHRSYAMGTTRTYSNISIGMLGRITAMSEGKTFQSLDEGSLFPALGLQHTFIVIPKNELANYAWGYTDEGKPIRMTLGVLWHEAYGVRTTASDMIRFVQENIDPSALGSTLRQAITQTHTGYFRDGLMTQDLIWEQYSYPVTLATLLDGNSYHMILDPTPASAIVPARGAQASAWLNKTGSTNGFGAYAAFVPSKRIGIVLLANRNYPIRERVTAAYRILSAIAASR